MAFALDREIAAAADRHGLDPEFLARVVHAESGGRPDAVSPAGAIGLGQLMPGTARELGVDPRDPVQNLDGSARYLRAQLDRFGDPSLAAAAYNAGPGAVERFGGVPPYQETQTYLTRVLGPREPPRGAPGGGQPSRAPAMASDEELDALFGGGAQPQRQAPQPQAQQGPQGGAQGRFDNNDGHVDEGELDQLFAESQTGIDGATVKRGPNGEIEIGITRSTNPEFLAQQAERERDPQWQAALSDARERTASAPDQIRAVNRGFLYGFADDLDARGAQAETWIMNGAGRLFGQEPDYESGQAYHAVMRANREADERYRAEHPYQNAGLEIVGGLAAPGALQAGRWVANGANVGARVARGAATGAAAGAAYGAGEGEGWQDRAVRAATGAVGGTVGGAAMPVVSSVAGKALAPVVGAFRPDWVGKTVPMEAYEAAERRLKTFGVEVKDLTPAGRSNLHALLKSGIRPEDAAVEVAGLGLPIPVPMTRGQVTMSPIDQLDENMLIRGARGQRAADQMRGFQQTQQDALRSNVEAIQEGMTGRGPLPRGRAGESASEALNSRYDAAKAEVNRAYDAVRNAPGAALPAYDMQAFAGTVRGAVEDFDPLAVPNVAREIDRLSALAERRGDADLTELFRARSRLTNLRKGGGVEGAAAGKAVKAFDDQISTALDEDLFRGDPATVTMWRDAIESRRDFGKLFEGNDLVHRLTAREPRSGRMQLAVDPADASRYIFSRSGLGRVGRQNLARDLGQLRRVLGPDSDEWNAIRAEAFARLADAGEGATDGATRQFSGVKFQKAWTDAMRDDPHTLSMLFTEPERATIRQFAGVAARATGTVKGGDNPSGTAVALKRLTRLPFVVGKYVPLIEGVVKTVDEQLAAGAAKKATMGQKGRKLPTNLQRQVDRLVIGGGEVGGGYAGDVLLPY